jgi:hypothetical protein
MPLNGKQVVEYARQALEWRDAERSRLNRIHDYIRGTQRFDWLPSGTPSEVSRLARMSQVNVMGFVVDASTQALYVDGYRSADLDEQPAWQAWQANRMDARQIGVHRSALSYGASYATVLPGTPMSKIRGVSPRNMTAVYGNDDDWPMWALETRSGGLLRLIDTEAVYWVGQEDSGLVWLETEEHGLGVCPVVRFKATENLDDEVIGDVEPLFQLQDQINVTTFSLLVAQHYGAHRQRYIIGWLAESEEQALKASAQKLWTFDDSPDDIKVGEFEQTQLNGYIESREATLRHLATISQTPVHELLGSMANLSAEALAAARDSHNRKLEERRTMFGEAWEQTLEVAAIAGNLPVDPSAWVRWRDMEARSLAQTADALGKLVQMLGVPAEALWERVPGVSQQEVEQWKTLSAQGGSLESLMRELAGAQTSPEGFGGIDG